MAQDPLAPIAPAKVRALVLPIGQIKRQKFATFFEKLNAENVVHLRDISVDGRPNRNMFSPLAFPDGAMFYDLVTHVPPASHRALSPFDLYREPLVLLAVADGSELGSAQFSKRHSGSGKSMVERNIRALDQDLEDLRDTYPEVLVHRVLIFDFESSQENLISGLENNITTIPPPAQCKRTTMRTVMCSVSSTLLAEMTTLAKSYEARTSIESPGLSAATSQANGSARNADDSDYAARRNSQYSLPLGARSSSASGVVDKSQARMSMPPMPHKPYGSGNSTPGRPSTPVKTAMSNPPTSFAEMTVGEGRDPSSPDQTIPARPPTAEGFRSQSQDRVSTQGFGPGSLTERWRNKGKGRSTIVLGSLYLQAGRWTDALKELVDGATLAKSINDHLWHGKALELTVICLLLLGWVGLEFQVPTVLLPPSEKGTSAALAVQAEPEADGVKQPKWIRTLQVVMPELLERIVGLYSRLSGEHLPALPLAEATIRFCKMLAALHVADGKLTEGAIEAMVLGTGADASLPPWRPPHADVVPSRTSINSLLFRAFPGSATDFLSTVDRITILGGIASVLGAMGYQRKKAMVVRELVSVLIGGLIEARTRGAAEMGIHPAAGLVALNGMNGQTNGAGALELGEGDIEHGMDAFLDMMLRTYGVITFDMRKRWPQDETEADEAVEADSDAAIVARILRQSNARHFGMPEIKLNVLRACINLSEALPDFAGVLRFSSDLLRTAGSGVAPGPRREEAAPAIIREEQVRLATNISKTNTLSQRLGITKLSAEYWDEFLVRGVKLEPLLPTRTPVAHAKSALPSAAAARTSQDVDPFIYNPFLKQPDKAAVDHVVVAGEVASFKLTMQNPYEMDVDIESVRLDTEGVDFETASGSTIIGPYRTQVLRLSGEPKTAGTLKIIGAVVKVRGCRERRFPIFSQPWALDGEAKVKSIGLSYLERTTLSPSSASPPLKTDVLQLNVIPQQPVVVVKSTSLPQSSVMILEGERQTFSVTLQNLSTTTPADFLLFSFQDSTQQALQSALNRRDATPAELYEYEIILAKKQALRFSKGSDAKRFIPPGSTATFDFEILGKPGLTHGVIQIDYANLGAGQDEAADKFHTRRVALRLTVTVNASVEVARMDVLPLHGSIPESVWQRSSGQSDKVARMGAELMAEHYCLLLLDLRNAWPGHMHVQLQTRDSEGSESATAAAATLVEEHILPGNTTRVLLPIRRVRLDDPYASIPALNPSRQRQFVVSSGKISPEAERANREAFWYRERILDSLSGTWRTTLGGGPGPERAGTIELRSMRLTGRMVEAVKIDDIGIEVDVLPGLREPSSSSSERSADGEDDDDEDEDDEGTTASKGTVFADDFVQLRVRITNRAASPIYPTLRIVPTLCHRPPNVALDFTRKLAWNGTLQRTLPLLKGGGTTTEVRMGFTALCRGEFEITASVEETKLWEGDAAEKVDKTEERQLMDTALGAKERRLWHTRRSCRVVVRERE